MGDFFKDNDEINTGGLVHSPSKTPLPPAISSAASSSSRKRKRSPGIDGDASESDGEDGDGTRGRGGQFGSSKKLDFLSVASGPERLEVSRMVSTTPKEAPISAKKRKLDHGAENRCPFFPVIFL